MIPLAKLNAAPDGEFVSLLGGIYEHSDWVPRKILRLRPFADFESLRQGMLRAVDLASDEDKLALILAHPDLGGKLARAGDLTAESAREQSGLGLDRLSEAEYVDFSRRNASYREKFGFPFIICARLTTKERMLESVGKRMANSRDEEISEALVQIHQIARLRLEDLVTA